jgi:hypothetical protein
MRKLILIGLVAFSANAFAQTLDPAYHRGYIIKEDGSKVEGIIEADLQFPWNVQDDIKFFDPKLLEQGKVKGKDKEKYGPKDIKGFGFDDRYYESQKYADMTAIGPASLGKYYFLERLEDGKIKLYRFFDSPPKVLTVDETFEQVYENLRNNPRSLIKKGDDKVKESAGFEKMINDCPVVMEKYQKGEYGNYAGKEDQTAAGKLITKMANRGNSEQFIGAVVRDYNANMK